MDITIDNYRGIRKSFDRFIDMRLWKKDILGHKYLIIFSILFFILSIGSTYFAGNYADRAGSAVSSDIILDNLPTVNLSFIYFYGILLVFAALFAYPLLKKISYFHVVLIQVSLLIMIRSVFICFTHLSHPADAIITNMPVLSFMNFQNDLFFSGHTAIPFLGFLLFTNEKIRYFFLSMAVILAATVLFMHVHYSIDVFSAVFITYGSFKIGNWLLKKFDALEIEKYAY